MPLRQIATGQQKFDSKKKDYKRYGWKNIAIKIKENDLILFNRQLDKLGFETLGDLVKELLAGKITRLTEDKQIEIMKINSQGSGQYTLQRETNYDFYKKIDIDELLKEYERRYHPKTAKCLVSYFRRYGDIFFGINPDLLLFRLKPHKRSWILQAMKRIGDYYFWKYNSRDVQDLVRRIIERYHLNKDLDMKDKIYLVNPGYIINKLTCLMAIPGHIGFIVRVGVFTGLREEELYYIYNKEICNNELGCKCDNLHVINLDNKMTIIGINWIRANKKAFVTILPTMIWKDFRNLPKFDRSDIIAAHSITKRDAEILYVGLRKIHYNVMRFKDIMNSDEADALAGRAKTTSAQHYVLHDLKLFSDKYVKAWNNFGINIENK